MRCGELIGRDAELGRLERRIAALETGGGGVVAVVGQAGAGKSRLVREALEAADVMSIIGRAIPAENPAPYRPVAEALLRVARTRDRPEDPSLAGFEGHLGRLVPSWGAGGTAEASPLLLGEAVVRLLTVLAADRPCVLVLDDIHWADPETLDVVDHLSEALRGQPVLCLCTARPEGPALPVLERLQRRDAADVVRLELLDDVAVGRMVSSCLEATHPPAGLSEFTYEHSDGNPFLVEELLAGLVATGTLQRDDGHWEITGPLTPSLPASLRESIAQRLGLLDRAHRRVLGAASLLGRLFDWSLLPAIADVDGRTAADALRAAVDVQLIEVDGEAFRFRHALTRAAVLDDLLPPDRRELATRAWPAIERAHPGLPGGTCQLAADLAEAAGDRTAAASRLLECARRAARAGAFASAEATARRARSLATADPALVLDVDEVLVDVLAAAGKSAEAISAGRDLARRLAAAGAPAARRSDLLVDVARAGLVAGDLAAADAAAADARAAARDVADPALDARLDAVAAEVAHDRVDLVRAEDLCRRAIEGARATDQPAVRCEALLTLGRTLRPRGVGRASAAFREAAEVAESAGLARWHLRAQQELALDSFDVGGAGQLQATRDLAARYGAHLTVAVMELSLADLALGGFDHAECLRAATACVDASRRYRLATEPVALLWLAGAHALGGDDAAMQAAIEAALDRDGDDPRILADLYGRVLATRAFVRDELDALPELMEEMMQHVRRGPPTTSVYPGRITWAVLHATADDDLGRAARDELRSVAAETGLPFFTLAAEAVGAIVLGRAGDIEAAGATSEPAYVQMTAVPAMQGAVHTMWLLVARTAIRDGWGDPVRWLRGAEAFFVERRVDRLVRRCRSLLAEAGAPVPRRGRGGSTVPTSLRALGVTSREVDVLKLVVAGLTTKEIAAELFLSPKTVERHLSNLFDRTGVRDRQALARVGAAHLLPDR